MKQLLPLICFFSLSLSLPAQKFVLTDNTWITKQLFFTPPSAKIIKYQFGEEVTMNGVKYLELKGYLFPDFETSVNIFFEYWREDDDGNVYSTNDGIIEFLQYSKGFVIGDSITMLDHTYKLIGVDSIQLKDASFRKSQSFSLVGTPSEIDVRIDGIGSLRNTFIPTLSFTLDKDIRLQCFYQNGELLYCGNNVDCAQYELSETQEINNDINVNFVNNQINITGDFPAQSLLRIYSIDGRLLQENTIEEQRITLIPNIISGILMYQISHKNALLKTGLLNYSY